MLSTFKVTFESKVWVSVKILGLAVDLLTAKILVTSPFVINMPTRELWAAEKKNSLV